MGIGLTAASVVLVLEITGFCVINYINRTSPRHCSKTKDTPPNQYAEKYTAWMENVQIYTTFPWRHIFIFLHNSTVRRQ